MRLWKSLCSIVLPLFIAKRAKADDGPIDFSQAPGYEDLRACAAHWIYNGRLINDLKGCPKISCICRTDLVEAAHEFIKKLTLETCGEDATFDVDQAIKVYNDYCSSNGFDIPGYTYIITATVTQPTETSLPEDDGGGTLTGSDTTSYTSSDTIQTDFPATGTDAAGTLYTGPFYGDPTGTAVATVTLVSGAGTKPNPFQLLQSHASCSLLHFLPCLLVSLPLRLIRALPETLVVTYVPPPPSESPAVTLVETLVKSTPEPAFTSTLVVHYSAPPRAATSTKFVYEDSIDDGQSDSKPEARSDGKQGLTTIELVGIIIGILTGLITTVATVWMCVVRGRRGIVAG